MRENAKEKFLQFDKSLLHVDYVCGMEFREDEKKCYVYLKNNHYARQPMTLKKYNDFQKKFLKIISSKNEL